MSETKLFSEIAEITNGASDVKDAKDIGKYPFFDRSVIVKRSDKFLFDSEAIIIPGEDSKAIFEPRYFNGKFDLHQRCYTVYDFKHGYYPKYFYFKLKTLTKHFANVFVGSTVPSLRLDNITDLRIAIPPYPYQKIVGDLLFNIDRKIATNNAINAELEKLAKTIYDYWFVQFDFPNEHGKPYKSAGGEMVYNELLKREIPHGWSAEKLSKHLKFDKGTEVGVSAYLGQQDENAVKFYRVADIDGNCSTFVDKSAHKLFHVRPKDIVVTFDGSIGKIGMGLDGAISGGLQKVHDQKKIISNSFIWLVFKDERTQRTILQYAHGSVLKHAGGAINYLTIPFDEQIIKNFQKSVDPLYEQIIKNKSENIELAALRDFLLPLLMNGQVTVGTTPEQIATTIKRSKK
jgi:type I restriction enzyme S subunit